MGVDLHAVLMGPWLLPLAVEPYNARMVRGDDLSELAFNVGEEAFRIRRAGGGIIPRPAVAPVRVMPIHDRIVDAETDAGLLAGCRQFGEGIALEGGRGEAP